MQLGEHADEVVVFGGLVPQRITTGAPAQHVGTTDVDVFVNLSVVYDRDDDDFSWLERGLLAGGFRSAGDKTWRWWISIDGHSVPVDLLVDVGDNRFQNVILPGCETVTAWNVPGPAPVGIRSEVAALPGEGAGPVAARFATVGAYLLAKASGALRRRHEPAAFRKDYYDLAFVVMYHRLGSSAELAQAVRLALPPPRDVDHLGDLVAALRELADEDGAAVATFVEEMGRAGADLDPDLLLQDCVSTCLELLDHLDPPPTA